MEEVQLNINFKRIVSRADRTKLESPLEEFFIHHLEKYISHQTVIIPQYKVKTVTGNFRLDFVLQIGERKIGIECDGKDFHHEWHDELRDAMILGGGAVDTIYRFRGKDIHTFIDDCIYIIYFYDKDLFNDRYHILAEQLASQDIRMSLKDDSYSARERNMFLYEKVNQDSGEQVGWLELLVERRDKKVGGHWQTLYSFAVKHPEATTIADLAALREKGNPFIKH